MLGFILGLCALALVGMALLHWGLKGRRVNDHPVCRDCRFDLQGVYPGEVTCPECGSGLKRPKAVRVGVRRRMWSVALLGLALLLLPAATLGASMLAALTGADLASYKPVGLLIWEYNNLSRAGAEHAASELATRAANKQLNQDQLALLIDTILDNQTDPDRPWVTGLGDVIERGQVNGVVSSSQWARYMAQAPALDVEARHRAAPGGILPIRVFANEHRLGSNTQVSAMLSLNGATIGVDTPLKLVLGPLATDNWFAGFGGAGASGIGWVNMGSGMAAAWGGQQGTGFALQIPDDLNPGAYTVNLTIGIVALDQTSAMNFAPNAKPTRTVPLTLQVNLSPSTEVDIKPIAPSEEADAVLLDALRPDFVQSMNSGIAGTQAWATYQMLNPGDLDLAFEVTARTGGQEWPAGVLTTGDLCQAGHISYGDNTHMLQWQMTKPPRPGQTVDLIFEPSPEVARSTLDLDAYYNGRIVIEDVPLNDMNDITTVFRSGSTNNEKAERKEESRAKRLLRALSGEKPDESDEPTPTDDDGG